MDHFGLIYGASGYKRGYNGAKSGLHESPIRRLPSLPGTPPNGLLVRGTPLMLAYSLNEPPPPPDSKLCPVCGAKIPFSLALHMMAAHSPDSKARLTETQISAHHQSRSKPRSDPRRPNNTRRRISRFKQKQKNRRH